MAKGLEFIPLSNASEFKTGKRVKFKLLKDSNQSKLIKFSALTQGYLKLISMVSLD